MSAIDPEAAVVHAAVWGDLDATVDAYEGGLLTPASFTDPIHDAVVAAIVAVLDQGQAPFPERVIRHLIDVGGWSQAHAVDAVVMPGTFVALGCRCGDLGEALAALNAHRERGRLEQRLIALADALHRPGGVARVAHVLGEAA